MTSIASEDKLNYYDERLISHLGLVYGEGFLSPGGPQEVAEIVRGVDLCGKQVLDIGCGVGGPAIALAETFKAGRVVSIDIQPAQIERISRCVESMGLGGRVIPTLVVPGRLPFEDDSFDIVFSKEAINESSDKAFMFQEIFRVLKPGGWLLASDWMKGDEEISELFKTWERAVNLPIEYERVSIVQQHLENAGYSNIALVSRREWYQRLAYAELLQTLFILKPKLMEIQKDEACYQFAIQYWKSMIHLLETGEFQPTHIRAQKPGDKS
jgi:phosphoethanolamine N-methyltransferase